MTLWLWIFVTILAAFQLVTRLRQTGVIEWLTILNAKVDELQAQVDELTVEVAMPPLDDR